MIKHVWWLNILLFAIICSVHMFYWHTVHFEQLSCLPWWKSQRCDYGQRQELGIGAVGVPVGQRLGGQLSMTLVATKTSLFFQRPWWCRPLAKSHIFCFLFLPGGLYWIGSDKSCSTLIGRHKLGVVQMHVYHPLSDAALRFFSLAEQCCTQNFYLRCFKSDTAYSGHWTH